MRPLVLSLVSFAWCVSCATPRANDRGPSVVQTSTPAADCVSLGPIEGADESLDVGKAWEHLQIGPSRTAAIGDALKQAAAKGATHASLGEPLRQDRGFSVRGVAYECPHAPAAPPTGGEAPSPAAALGCFKDTDCKGDRICRNRECVDP